MRPYKRDRRAAAGDYIITKNIGTYIKTRDIFAEYRKSGWSKKFHAAHEQEIESHKAAKKAFDELGLEKLPTIKTLQTEYVKLESEKKSLWAKHKGAREFMHAILTVKQNARELLGYSENMKTREAVR